MKYLVVKITDIDAEQLEILTAMLPEFGLQGMEEFENSVTAYAKESECDVNLLHNYFLKRLKKIYDIIDYYIIIYKAR